MLAGGSFLAIGSELGRTAGAGAGVYSVTRASVDLLVRIAAAEPVKRGVRVNCLSPGGMAGTTFNKTSLDEFRADLQDA